ncbi:hypothetical protein B0T26DRAFT_800182 [Lasiosphaeria miniovina]|uniref:Uncharacterized protein n=1 Tax=Lasiosphaeria miniovina TaxID=1954250 RepID=A0AA40B6Y2_9PEZI|nr:uncharacterized protein B0T26DRAFT_800182 [Lasiosphaeria miniovina]KAK0728423.1 hypothetical protein B0T26DRAFT_800182 [Lasiosphaeria miniovina]
MGSYPGNPKRVQRVKDLAGHIADYQFDILSQNDAQKEKDERAHETLESVAKYHGFSSIWEYTELAIAALPAEENERYNNLRHTIRRTGRVGKNIIVSMGAIATLGLIPGEICEASADLIDSLGKVLKEAFENFQKVLSEISLSDALAEAGSIAAEGAAEASVLTKFGQIAAKPVFALATIDRLVHDDGIESEQLIEKCREYTLDLASKHYMVRKLKEDVETAFSFTEGVIHSLFQDTLDADEGTPSGEKHEIIARKVKEALDRFAILKVPGAVIVSEDLRRKDMNASSWTNEDPDVVQMMGYLEMRKKTNS